MPNVRPDVTLLDWLRLRARQTGTKEGCASGDCGACTVVVARPAPTSTGLPLHYESINSCIAFLGSIHGCYLLTVEDLAPGVQLHPVQQAMVECHGSQCGFCTPGFIMSMFSLYQAQRNGYVGKDGSSTPLAHTIDRYLGGNLCRCTGYRSIKTAMMLALERRPRDEKHPAVQAIDTEEKAIIGRLLELQQLPDRSSDENRCFHQPRSIVELNSLRQQYPDARLLGGGTDLALDVTQSLQPLDRIIYLKKVPELLTVSVSDSGVSVGAAVTLSRCMESLQQALPGLKALLLRYGSEQIRNAGTIGGNLANASPIGDFPPILLAADATLTLNGPNGLREVGIQSFFKAYKTTELQADEYIQSVFIPNLAPTAEYSIHKISKRFDDDISTVCGVFHWQRDGACIKNVRLAFGGMDATPRRARSTEQILEGAVLSESVLAVAEKALETDFSPISDARASADYRLKIAGNLLRRVWNQHQSPGSLHHVADYVHG